MIPSVPAAAAVAGEDPTRANASYAHDQPAATLPAAAQGSVRGVHVRDVDAAVAVFRVRRRRVVVVVAAVRVRVAAAAAMGRRRRRRNRTTRNSTRNSSRRRRPRSFRPRTDDFGMSGGGGAYGDASGAGGGGWASTAPTRLPPRGRARGDDGRAVGGGVRVPTSHDGGDFSAYNTGGSSHATGDAGTPRSTHGRPPCVGIGFGFRREAGALVPGVSRRGRRRRAAARRPGTSESNASAI